MGKTVEALGAFFREVGGPQGDPNAHESVRCKVEVGGDASGAEVKRAVEGAVKASDKPAEWDGGSTPAVGSVVEYSSAEGFVKAVVIGHGMIDPSSIVIEFHDGGIDVTEIGCLRPIRSEREKAVEDMMQEAGYSASDCYVSDYHVVALVVEAIYDAGYRKTEGA